MSGTEFRSLGPAVALRQFRCHRRAMSANSIALNCQISCAPVRSRYPSGFSELETLSRINHCSGTSTRRCNRSAPLTDHTASSFPVPNARTFRDYFTSDSVSQVQKPDASKNTRRESSSESQMKHSPCQASIHGSARLNTTT